MSLSSINAPPAFESPVTTWSLPNGGMAPSRWDTVRVRPVAPRRSAHSIHAYFNASPESPDGDWVLYFASRDPEGHCGQIEVRGRRNGTARVLARRVVTEDAHRVACQQWISGGRRVVFHQLCQERWRVVCVDLEILHETVLAEDRLLGWGPAAGDLVPVYGPHWDPGTHRDLELVDASTGAIHTAMTTDQVRAAFPEWVDGLFGSCPVSIFFPVLSPDGCRVFFKLATPGDGDFRSSRASLRKGIVGYDLRRQRFLFAHHEWGHPSWHPDSRTILTLPNILIDSDTGRVRPIPNLPRFPGSHPSASPEGVLFATEAQLAPFGEPRNRWGLVVAALDGSGARILHRFRQGRGARSWRPPHPHPAFSPDGRRLYFNVSGHSWTRLYVAEAGEEVPR